MSFANIRKEIENYDQMREDLIIQCRKVLKTAKIFIYTLHKGGEVAKQKKELAKQRQALDKISKRHPHLPYEGCHSDAIQEYVEAMGYYQFLTKGDLISPAYLKVTNSDYLMGVCDLTGELSRRAVFCAIKGDTKQLNAIHDFVDHIAYEFLQFQFRNGHLRKKSDAIKWNLKRIEEVLYDYGMRKDVRKSD